MLLQPSHYRNAAKNSLANASHPSRVILLHTGVILLVSLIVTLVDHLLDKQIMNTGGLGGMGQRSVLTTVQAILHLAQLVLLPFWQIGYTCYTVRLARGQAADIPDLYEGFRQFGRVFRLRLLLTALLFLLAMVSAYAGSFLFGLTRFSTPMMEEMELLMGSNLDEAALSEALMNLMQKPAYLIPLAICFGACFLTGGVFLFFRFRFAEMWLMDHPKCSPIVALKCSRMMLRNQWGAMLKIDLSFWWFYLLELLVTALGFGDLILTAFGIELTTDAFGSYILFFCLYIWAQMTLYWWKRNHVSLAYAHAYLSLCPPDVSQNT